MQDINRGVLLIQGKMLPAGAAFGALAHSIPSQGLRGPLSGDLVAIDGVLGQAVSSVRCSALPRPMQLIEQGRMHLDQSAAEICMPEPFATRIGSSRGAVEHGDMILSTHRDPVPSGVKNTSCGE